MKKIILLFMLTLASFRINAANVTVSVSPSKTYQTIEGIGGGIVYYLDWITNHKNKAAIYDTIFTGLGISGLRVGNWAQEADADLSFDAEIISEAKKRLGDDCYVMMSCWSAPASLKANNSLSGTNGGSAVGTLKKSNGKFVYDQYGAWWKRTLQQYQAVGIFPDYISIQNEPDMDADYESTLLAATESSTVASYGKALSAVASSIEGLNNKPKIIGPEVLGIGWDNVQKYVAGLDLDLIDGLGFHYYHSGLNDHDDLNLRYSYPDDFLEAMKGLYNDYKNVKPLFMTENSSLREEYQTNDPIYMAWFMCHAFTVNHVASYLHWNLTWGNKGDGCMNIEDPTQAFTTSQGFTIKGDYHSLRHFSKFIKKGWICIDATSSSSDVLTAAFKSPDGNSYTVVLVNKSTSNHSANLSLNVSSCLGSIVQSVPASNVWSKVIGQYSSGSSVSLPANSITTLVFTPKPKKYIYDCVDASDLAWTNTLNWTPSSVPESQDTTIIRNGEVKATDQIQNAPVYVESKGTYRILNTGVVSNLYLQGGTLKSYTSNPLFVLTADIDVQKTSTIMVGSIASSVFKLNGKITGSSNLTKNRMGVLNLTSDGSDFTGTWILTEGTISVDNSTALGQSGVTVEAGTLDINVASQTYFIDIADSSVLNLDANLTVDEAVLGDDILKNGKYTSSDYPDFITGTDTLIVAKPYPLLIKQGAGGSKQTILIGNPIVDFNYKWENATSAKVTWSPSAPDGISVKIDNNQHKVIFSGTPAESGKYSFTVSTVSDMDSVYKKSGYILVNSMTVGLPSAESVPNTTFEVYPNPVKNISHINLFSEKEELCELQLLDMLGSLQYKTMLSLKKGENLIKLNLDRFAANVYILKIKKDGKWVSKRILKIN